MEKWHKRSEQKWHHDFALNYYMAFLAAVVVDESHLHTLKLPNFAAHASAPNVTRITAFWVRGVDIPESFCQSGNALDGVILDKAPRLSILSILPIWKDNYTMRTYANNMKRNWRCGWAKVKHLGFSWTLCISFLDFPVMIFWGSARECFLSHDFWAIIQSLRKHSSILSIAFWVMLCCLVLPMIRRRTCIQHPCRSTRRILKRHV